METVDLSGWRTQPLSDHHSGLLLDLLSDGLITETELSVLMERSGQQHHGVNMGLVHGLGLVPCEEPDIPGVLEHRLPVLLHSAVDDVEIGVDETWSELSGCPEIEETDLVCSGIEEKVCPVGISLHQSVKEKFPEDQLQDGLGYEVPGVLRQSQTAVYSEASDVLSCQHLQGQKAY